MFHKRLLSEFRENRKYVVLIVLCQWISLIASVLFTYDTAKLVLAMYNNEINTSLFVEYAIVILVTLVVKNVMSKVANDMSYKASTVVKTRLRKMVFEKLTRLGSSYRENFSSSEAVQVSTEGVEQLEIYFGKYVPQFFYSLLAPLTLFVIVSTMSIKAALILLICVPLIPVSIVAVQKFAKKMLNKYWGTYTELGDSFLENLSGLTTLKIYNADEFYAKKMDEESEKFRKVTMRVLIMQLNSISIMDLVAYGGAALGIIFSILEYKSGNIGLAQCFFIIMISAEFFLPLRMLGSFFHIAMNGNAAANKIFRLLDEEEHDTGTASVDNSEIVFEDVDFGYDNDKVISNISFTIREHAFVAFVGESGCGKSTIASIMMGEHRDYSGKISIGGVSLKDISTANLHKKITRITHDSYIFKGTVRDNLLMANKSASDEELMEALQKVDLYTSVVEKGGLDMQITEKGSNLSGGQRQRLAVARALLHNTDIYIFDEATSNVDVESENKIMEVIAELSREKTVILISHRLANVIDADNIYVMTSRTSNEAGHIAQTGTHDMLMDNRGIYYDIFSSQKSLEDYLKEA